ncbi:hypothetical protein B0H66DRAFT_615571 [Apodospora peruviana]|uniref:Uncharacterized protein n=1 Tax=Apodospora peruviana TaxID=516989 RepID=A0AAE0IHG2_9PEZI|nr:hypothetical protein B0H66DRAFT_615571 [Apodospora peruviana]
MARPKSTLAAVLLHTGLISAAPVAPDLPSPGGSAISTTTHLLLKPVRNVGRGNTKRDRRTALSLKQEETLYWSGEGWYCGRVQDGDACGTNGTFNVRVAETADFNDTQDIWQWVNQDPANHFTLVVGAGTCGGNEHRILYTVENVVYNDEAETAILDVRQTTWKAAAHIRPHHRKAGWRGQQVVKTKSTAPPIRTEVFSTTLETPSKTRHQTPSIYSGRRNRRRVDGVNSVVNPDTSPDFTIPSSNDFSTKSLTFSTNGVSITAAWKEGFSQGSFDIRGLFRARKLQIQQAWIEVSTQGIDAKAILGTTLNGALTGQLASKSVPIFRFSPGGVAIPGLLTIGPTVSVSLGAEISEVSGGVAITLGGMASIPASTSRLDFLSESGTASTGWEPSLEAEPFTADIFVEAKATAFLRAALGLEINAVEWICRGAVGQSSRAHRVSQGHRMFVHSLTCTACGDHENGVQRSLALGTSIGVSFKEKTLGSEKAPWSLTLTPL